MRHPTRRERARGRPLRGGLAAALCSVLAAALLLPGASAVVAAPATTAAAAASPEPAARERVLAVAASLRGIPYRAGGTSPATGFDCSGYTSYVFRTAVGIDLPRVSRDQYAAAEPISRDAARPGDLVFFHRGGRVYHASIYAGGNTVWHAPYPGRSVTRERIWSASVYFARVI